MKNSKSAPDVLQFLLFTPTFTSIKSNQRRHDLGNAGIPLRAGVVETSAEVPINGIAVSSAEFVIPAASGCSSACSTWQQ
jgi:hypothetical protein